MVRFQLFAGFSLDLGDVPFNICLVNGTTAIYLRVSTANGSQSTDSQEREVRQYCAARGWNEVEVFKDHLSGAKASRPELDRMVGELRHGRIARVACLKLDRLGRSLTHLALIIGEMKTRGVPLICTSQGIDTSDDNPCGKLQLGVLMAVAEFERGIIVERVRSGLANAKSKGVRLGRPATLQHRREAVLALKAKGLGLRRIAKELKMPVSSVAKVVKESQPAAKNERAPLEGGAASVR